MNSFFEIKPRLWFYPGPLSFPRPSTTMAAQVVLVHLMWGHWHAFHTFLISCTHRFKPANIVMTMRKDMNINFVRHSWFTWWSVTCTQNWGSHKKEQKKDGITFEDRHQSNCWSWGGWNKSSAQLIRSLSPGKIDKIYTRFGYMLGCNTNRSFSFELPPHQLLCMLYIGDKGKILK